MQAQFIHEAYARIYNFGLQVRLDYLQRNSLLLEGFPLKVLHSGCHNAFMLHGSCIFRPFSHLSLRYSLLHGPHSLFVFESRLCIHEPNAVI